MPPLGIFVLSFIVTIVLTLLIQNTTRKEESVRFDYVASRIAVALENRVKIYENVLIATRNMFLTTPFISREVFRDFVEGFRLGTRYPGVQGVGFTRLIPDSQVAKHEQEMRNEGFKNYQIWPKVNDGNFTIVFLEPFDWRNKRALGYNMFSEPIRHDAMAKARDTGKPALSRKVLLVQETEQDPQPGFLLYVPVYINDIPLDTVKNRRKALKGFVYSPFRAGDFFERISTEVKYESTVRARVYDGDQVDSSHLLFDSHPGVAIDTDPLHKTVPIKVAGHLWTLSLTPTSEFSKGAANRWAGPLVFFLGTIISFLIFFVAVFAKKLNAQLRYDLEMKQKSEAELKAAHRSAEEANQAKSRFLASMSHEIRTPLGVILGYSELALESFELEQELRNYLLTIHRNGQQLVTLVGEILDLSKIEANRMELELIEFPFKQTIEEICFSLQLRAAEKGIKLVCGIDGPVPNIVKSDITKFRQILVNLIGNAIKFTSEGEVRVTAKMISEAVPGEPMILEILVADTGIGIGPKFINRMFQPFVQEDSSTTRKYGGTGLGLVLSKQLAQMLGGDVRLQSTELGKGSTFAFQFQGGPFQGLGKAEPTRKSEEDPVAQGNSEEKTLDGIRILLVEDSIDNQNLFSRYLLGSGAIVDIANDGVEALEKTKRQEYDVVLMDIQMPNLDGHGATRALRERGFENPIIALTAHAFQEERRRVFAGGFNGYLTKPINRRDLILEISKSVK